MLLLQQRSKHPREMVITPKASTSRLTPPSHRLEKRLVRTMVATINGFHFVSKPRVNTPFSNATSPLSNAMFNAIHALPFHRLEKRLVRTMVASVPRDQTTPFSNATTPFSRQPRPFQTQARPYLAIHALPFIGSRSASFAPWWLPSTGSTSTSRQPMQSTRYSATRPRWRSRRTRPRPRRERRLLLRRRRRWGRRPRRTGPWKWTVRA